MARIRVALEDLATLPVTCRMRIPEDFLDMMGHMNVMWYTHLFSEATRGFFELFGLTVDYMRRENAGSFALESHVHYLSEVRVGQSVEVRSRVLGRSAKRLHLMHFMVNQDRKDLSATSEKIGMHIDMTQRRSSPFPREIADRIDAFRDEHARLNWPAPVCGAMHA